MKDTKRENGEEERKREREKNTDGQRKREIIASINMTDLNPQIARLTFEQCDKILLILRDRL
jgi:hypothetical protein